MDVYGDFGADSEKEVEGVWVDYDDKTKFLIARSGNKNFNRVFSRSYAKHKPVLSSKGPAAEAKAEELLAEVMSETILLGWQGPVSLRGVALTYSTENAKKLLMVKDFRNWISTQSEDFTHFKAVAEEAEAKN